MPAAKVHPDENKPVCARVLIWYPSGPNIGHASMTIGDIELTHLSQDNTRYVSWWPSLRKTSRLDTQNSAPSTYQYDTGNNGENCLPHVTYTLYDLSIENMEAEWNAIRAKPNAHYRTMFKNCSTIVARVLRAGGAGTLLGGVKELSYAHNLYWTPKNVAQLCDKLRDAGHAEKQKAGHCPTKGNTISRVLSGLR